MREEIVNDCGKIQPRGEITELIFILDKSGSMAGMESDTIGGFNSMIEKQKEAGGTVYVSTVLFSNRSEFLHDREKLDKVKPMTEKDYRVGGCTALLDAIGNAIKHIGNIHKYIREEDVPVRTMFVITTDGMENASREYSSDQIKEMIRRQEKEHKWEFLFLAANIDAVSAADSIGIRRDRAVDYSVERETKEMYRELGDIVCAYVACDELPTDCRASFERSLKKRKAK